MRGRVRTVSRRVAILLLVALAACGGDDEPDDPVVDRTGEVPADVQALLDRVADPSTLTLDLTYDLLNKNGGGDHEVHVTSPPLAVTIDGEPVDLDDQPALAAYGIFAGFLAENPAAAIDAAARREDADDAVFSERDGMDCIAIPIAGTATSTWCLTDDGVFGYVDSPSVRYELRAT
jgi:hypothetical protein